MSDLPIPRHLLEKYFGDDPRMVAAMEEQSQAVETSTAAVAATEALKDATVIVLSPNGDFTNERVLEWDEGIEVELTDSAVIFRVKDVALTREGRVMLVAPADVELFLPLEGTIVSDVAPALLFGKMLDAPRLASIPNYANDAAAAAGGVEVAQVYRNGSVLMVRVA